MQEAIFLETHDQTMKKEPFFSLSNIIKQQPCRKIQLLSSSTLIPCALTLSLLLFKMLLCYILLLWQEEREGEARKAQEELK